MRFAFVVLLALCGCGDDDGGGGGAFDTAPARAVLQRLLPPTALRQIELRAIAAAGGDRIELSGETGHVVVAATTPATLLAGVNWYCKDFAGVSINWNGDSLDRLPDQLPAPAAGYVREPLVAHRFAGNDTWSSYTGPYWSFERWQREIDLLAANGINEVLLYPGTAAVYYATFRELGLDDAALRAWVPLPAHQPWFLLHNMYGITEPISPALLDEQAELGRRIADYARSLGITPVLPGYFGMVPPEFAAAFPAATVTDQGVYIGTQIPQSPQLDPTDPLFAEVAEVFYRHSDRLFGATDAYMATPYHEGGVPGDTPLPEQFAAIEAAMQTHRPGSTWVLLAWFLTFSLDDGIPGTDPAHVLVLDGTTDSVRPIDPEEDLAHRPYALGSIWQFGGRTQMTAWLPGLLDAFQRARTRADSALAGVALLPEANDNNPAAFAFLSELAWEVPADVGSWMRAFAVRRYGGYDAHAEAAWQVLGRTVYGAGNVATAATTLEPSDAFVTIPDVAAHRFRAPYRNQNEVDEALAELLAVDPALRGSSAYRYDLMDVARHVLGNHSYTLHDELVDAFAARDADAFAEAAQLWLDWLQLADELTATNAQALTGVYQVDAAAWGPEARVDALQLITIWAYTPSEGPLFGEYANRGWQGMYGDYYAVRWASYLDQASTALRTGAAAPRFDAFAYGDAWSREVHDFPTAAAGDVHAVATRVLAAVRAATAGE